MQSGLLKNIHPFTKILFALFLAVLTVTVVSVLGGLIPVLLFHKEISEMLAALSDFSDPTHIGWLKYFQILQSIGLFLVPALLSGFLLFGRGFQEFGFKTKTYSIEWGLVILIFFTGIPMVNVMSFWNQHMQFPEFLSGLEAKLKAMEESAAILTEAFLNTRTVEGLLINMIMIAILPALGEELFFRGLIQKILVAWVRKPWLAVFLAAFLFSFMHMQFYGFIPRLYLGLIFGLIYYRTNSIWLPIGAHFLNNGSAVLLYYFYGKEFVEQKTDTMGTDAATWYLTLISIIAVVFLLWQFYKVREVRRKST